MQDYILLIKHPTQCTKKIKAYLAYDYFDNGKNAVIIVNKRPNKEVEVLAYREEDIYKL